MKPRVLTALPVYNEALHVNPVLDQVRKYSEDVLAVDDGSSDGTREILAKRNDIRVIRHEKNGGYGSSLKTAFEYAIAEKYDVLVTIDCDGQHQPCLIPPMAAKVFENPDQPYDIVSGSRYLKTFPGDTPAPIERREINLKVTALLNERLGLSLTDTFCGFKAYRVEALKKLDVTELGYAMPLQLWVQAVAAGFSIIEFPVPLVYLEEERSFGGSLDDGRRRLAYYLEVIEREMAKLPCSCP